MIKKLFIFLILYILSSCATFRNYDLGSAQPLPPTSSHAKISLHTTSQCYTRGGAPLPCPDYRDDLFAYLQQSNLFSSVGLNDYYADYKIDIKFIHDNNFSLAMSILTAIPPLGLIPTLQNDDFYITIDVTNNHTRAHRKNLLQERMFTFKGWLFAPLSSQANPLHEFLTLKEDILNNILQTIYQSITILPHKT